jgi:hypothetical protein
MNGKEIYDIRIITYPFERGAKVMVYLSHFFRRERLVCQLVGRG